MSRYRYCPAPTSKASVRRYCGRFWVPIKGVLGISTWKGSLRLTMQQKANERNTRGPTLEVIACSVSDAVEAQSGGAGRLEIVRDLASGGLTPPLELVQEILAAVTLPVRVMLREGNSYEVSGHIERERL